MTDWGASASSSGGTAWGSSVGGQRGAPTPSHGGGGGLFSGLEHLVEAIPGSNIISNAVGGAENYGAQMIHGAEYAADQTIHGHLLDHVIEPALKGYEQKYLPILEHPLTGSSYAGVRKDPFGTFLDALTIATIPFTGGGSLAIRAGDLTLDAGRAAELSRAAELTGAERESALAKLGGIKPGEKGYFNAKASRAPRERSVVQIPGEAPVKYKIEPARTPWGKAIQSKVYSARESGMALPFSDRAIRDTPVIGANPRLVKVANSQAARKATVYQQIGRQGQAATKGLTDDEAFAQHVAAQGVPLNELIPYYEKQLTAHPTPVLEAYVERLKSPAIHEILTNPSEKFIAANHKLHDIAEKGAQDLVEGDHLDPEGHLLRTVLPQRMVGGAEHTGEEIVGGPSPVDLLGQPNRVNPEFAEAYRWPHDLPTNASESAGLHSPPAITSALSDKKLNTLQQNTGEAFKRGEFGKNPEHLLNDFLKGQRFEHFNSVKKNVLLPIARDLSSELPTGKHPLEHYIRTGKPGAKAGQVSKYVKGQDELMRELGKPGDHVPQSVLDKVKHHSENTVFNEHEMPQDLRDILHHEGIEGLKKAGVKRINPAYAKRFRADFGGVNKGWRKFDRALGWWKNLQLYTKPAYGVHNIVQQHTLLALQSPGAYRDMATLIRNPEVRAALREHPRSGGLIESGFFGVNAGGVHSGVYSAKEVGMAAKRLGIAPKILADGIRAYPKLIREINVRYAENLPKEAQALHRLRPMLKQFTAAGHSLDEAIRMVDPEAMERTVNDVLGGLGDWNAMSPAERHTLSRLMPLAYPWFRTIAAISGKMIFRYPGRLSLINAIEHAAPPGSPVPSWLKDAIRLGPASHGVQTMLETGALNPFATFSQTAGTPLASNLNPLLGSLITGVSGRDPFTGSSYYGPGATFGSTYPYDPSTSTSAQLSRFAGSIIGGLPQYQLYQSQHPYKGGLYSPHNYAQVGPVHANDALLGFLGLPVKHVRLSKAKAEKNR